MSDGAVETADATTASDEAPTSSPSDKAPTSSPSSVQPLQGPIEDEMVRIILYGLSSSAFLGDANGMDRWRSITESYIEDFFNKYPTQEMIDSGTTGPDAIRSSVFDVEVTISGEDWEEAPEHDFDPLVAGDVEARDADARRNLRIGARASTAVARRTQVGMDPSKIIMVTYSQTYTYRLSLDFVNDDPNFIMRRPLETPEYRADYVAYLRSMDFTDFGDLEYVSNFMYSEFPTPSPTTLEPTGSPVLPGEPTMPPQSDELATETSPPPTENVGCSLCKPGQIGIDADVILNGEAQPCMDVYSYFLENFMLGSPDCQDAQSQLSSICCQDADGAENVDDATNAIW